MTTINSSFTVTGGETQRAPNNALFPNERVITIHTIPSTRIPSLSQWNGEKVWLLVPGFTELGTHFDKTLAPTISDADPNNVVLALDWTQVSGSTVPAPLGILMGDLYRSASWITPVAKAVRDKFISWGMPATDLNVIGDSLGAYLTSEIAASFSDIGSKVGSATALDPASNQASDRSPYDTTNGFDTDLSNGFSENDGTPNPVKRLDLGAKISRGFNGNTSPSGNESQSGTARESFLFDFGNRVYTPSSSIVGAVVNAAIDKAAQFAEHGRVVTAYKNLITTTATTDPIAGIVTHNSRLATNILGINDTLADHQFRPDFYKGGFKESLQVHEGVIPVDAQDNPLFLVAAKLNGGVNDRFIYGTNSDDYFNADITGLLGTPFSSYYSNDGNHTYSLGNGNDTVYAGAGKDTIYGEAGNDYLYGGGIGGNTIFGEAGNDYREHPTFADIPFCLTAE